MSLSVSDEQIQAQAVRLGLIANGEELPRHHRSKVVASLAAEKPATSVRGEPQLAREISVQPGGDILVDGEPFPWLVARERMEIVLGAEPGDVCSVRLTLLADRVRITEPASESENRA